MFGWLTKKKLILHAPTDGNVVNLEVVNDEVFSKKMAGDGVALIPKGDTFFAPAAGVITKIFPTNHAFILSVKKIDIIVHIGIDTVKFEGKGFERHVNEGQKVDVHDAVISIDREFLEKNGADLTTPIVVNSAVNMLAAKEVKANQPIMEVEL